MSLSGNLRTMALPEILQWISMGRKTGTLVLERGEVRKQISFENGLAFTSWSNDPREYMGRILVRMRLISEEQLFRALLEQEETGAPLGRILRDGGALDETALVRALTAKAEETVYDLFLWPDGQFALREGELPADVPVRITLDVTHAVFEGARRVDEWERIRSVFGSMDTTLRLRGAAAGIGDPRERQALGLCARGQSLSRMALELYASEFEAAALVFDLHERGLVEIAQRVEAGPAQDVVARIRSGLDAAAGHAAAGRWEPALAAYEQVLQLDHLNQHAKKGLIAAIEGRSRQRLVKAVPLDKVPVMVVDFATLTKEKFDPQEGFVLSRVNGQWDVRSILKLCPMPEEDAILIFARLLERKVIELR